jgi:hypothetical protein
VKDLTPLLNAAWLNTLVGAVIGSIFGGVVGYSISHYQKTRDTVAKREALSRALQVELSLIGDTMPPYDVTQAFYRDPIRLSALPLLLDGGTLEYRSHDDLIRSLLLLQASVAKYNDFVQTTNLAQSVAPVPDSAHAKMYADMVQRHQLVLVARAEVLKYLPALTGTQAPENAERRRWLPHLSPRKVVERR